MSKSFIYSLLSYALLMLATENRIYADAPDSSDMQALPIVESSAPSNEVLPQEIEQSSASSEETSADESPSQKPVVAKPQTRSISAFTGKIIKNKVRMRLQPNLDSAIVREFKNGEMVVVTGENEEFYAIQPPADIKGYMFRTFVLDGVVEGNHVNVRMEPDLSSPVIAQMNSGERINGAVSARDKKWFELSLPDSVRFYISKDYIEKVGDASYLSKYTKRQLEVTNLLTAASRTSQIELQKPFNQINIDDVTKDLQKVISQYSDFPNEIAKAKELLTTIQTAYLSKKVAYMESNQKPVVVTAPQQQTAPAPVEFKPVRNVKMAAWDPVEESNYNIWAAQNGNGSMEEFYQQQINNAVQLKGVVEAYNKPIRNKPGDFVLLNSATHLPIAYLYSTRVNLQDMIGQEVTLQAAPRDSRHFAYPAYFVLSTQ